MKFCFIILHYKNINETIKCISSIQLHYKEYNLVIIDNASNDGTGDKLKQLYLEFKQIDVLILHTTRGFSYANNYGIRYAKQKYNPDFLIVCNNDIQFIDSYLYEKITKIYDETEFAVLGPDIYYVKMAEHQSPFRISYMNIEEAFYEIEYYQKRLDFKVRFRAFFEWLYSIDILTNKIQFIRSIKQKVYFIMKRKALVKQHKEMNCSARQYDVCLYGACLIVSREYFSVFEDVFFPETLFYAEEDILLTKCVRNNLRIVYDPSIQVTHTNKASTFIDGENRYKKTIWRLQQLIESRYIYIDFLKSFDKKFCDQNLYFDTK